MCPAEALPEAGSAPTWLARFSIGSGNHRQGGALRSRYGLGMGYTLINRDDASIENFREIFFKIRRALGTTAFGINGLTVVVAAARPKPEYDGHPPL